MFYKKRSFIKIVASIVVLSFILGCFCTTESDAASKNETVYIISQITSTYHGKKDYVDTRKYKYSNKGLLSEMRQDKKWKTYNYSNYKMIGYQLNKGGDEVYEGKYTYKNGKIVKRTETQKSGDHIKYYSYDKKGRITEEKSEDGKISSSLKYNKKNQVVKTYVHLKKKELFDTYTYNDKGYVKKRDNTRGFGDSYTYTYNKKGLVTKVSDLWHGNGTGLRRTTSKIKYKAIKVPKSKAKIIKKQQKEIFISVFSNDIYLIEKYDF